MSYHAEMDALLEFTDKTDSYERGVRDERLRIRRELLASIHPHITANEMRNVVDRVCPEEQP